MRVFLKVNWERVRPARGLGVNELDAIGAAEPEALPRSPTEDKRFERASCGRGGPSVEISKPSLATALGATTFWPWSGLGMTRILGRMSSRVEYGLSRIVRPRPGNPLAMETPSLSRSIDAFEYV